MPNSLPNLEISSSTMIAADELGLPPCSREDLFVTLSTVERTSYESLKREFLDAVRQIRRHQDAVSHQSRRGGTGGRATAALTALRQSTCHPMVVASNAASMGGHRLSMAEIIYRLVSQAYNEFDSGLRSLIHAKVLGAAVKIASTDGEVTDQFKELLELIDFNAMLSELSLDDRNKCPELRYADGSLDYKYAYPKKEACDALLAKMKENLEREEKECEAEDEELKEQRDIYRQQVLEEAQAWDIANPPKEKKEAKGGNKAGRGKALGKRSMSRAEESRKKEENIAGDAGGSGDHQIQSATAIVGGGQEEGDVGPSSSRPSSREQPQQRKGPTANAMKHARAVIGPRPQLPPDRLAVRQEAASRRRSWDRLKLAALELIVHVHKETLGEVSTLKKRSLG